ncbi:MAG TPA: sensor histidine kinase [Verrucomicrobiae bacterium]
MLGRLSAGAAEGTNDFWLKSVFVNGRSVAVGASGQINLGANPENILFGFRPENGIGPVPLRLHYTLDGVDSNWHEAGGEMGLTVRFYNHAGDLSGQSHYPVHGESTGWTGSLRNSALTHRRETFLVPPGAEKLLVVISSAGPPDSIGIYLVANLVVSKAGGQPLLRSPFDNELDLHADDDPPAGWMHDGTRPSIARVLKFGQDPQTRAFAVLDEDASSHGEWHNLMDTAPVVVPGERLVVEWNEMYSVGLASLREARYDHLQPGNYVFRINGLDAYGRPVGTECRSGIFVPQPFWKAPWFWGACVLAVTGIIMGISRYLVWQKMRREMLRLKQQQALEQERLRIAHDIHDDLGARVTQISLLSAMAHNNQDYPVPAREHFDKISRMSRELVAALYQTVWAVSPENDNLEALGSYLCQMANQLCEQTSLRCRFHVQGLPPEVQVSSQTRHNVSLVVKEAVHNIIKHARAKEITMRTSYAAGVLEIVVQDDGLGFDISRADHGNGLVNMKCRLENIGGRCEIESQPGHGTAVRIRLPIQQLPHLT